MEYQKVGRGGAGNFYSPQDVEKASKETAKVRKASHLYDLDRERSNDFKDLEAQRNAATEAVKELESQGRQTSTSGRGGAGNITTRDELAARTTANIDVTPSLQESNPPELGHYGRGGAGNYRTPEPEKMGEGDKDRLEAQEKAHQMVVKDVERALKEPEKAHLGKESRE